LIGDQLTDRGLSVNLVDGKIRLSPSKQVTEEVRHYVQAHRKDIITELSRQVTDESSYIDPYEINENNEICCKGKSSTYSEDDLLTGLDDPASSMKLWCNVPGVGEFWIAANEQVRETLIPDDLPILFPQDLTYITEGSTKDERFARLHEIVARRHPTTCRIVDAFNGKITSIKPKATGKHGTDHPVSE